MTCANHPELEATAFCRECGKPMCAECQRPALGSIYCAEHVPAAAANAPNPAFPNLTPPPAWPPEPPPATSGNASAAMPVVPPSPYSAGTSYSGSAYSGAPYSTAVPPIPPPKGGGPSPALAFILGFMIPGVGAIYNGQYAKGLVHAVIFGVLVSLIDAGHHTPIAPLLGIFLAIWVFYMAFEAYHTARKRRLGIPIEELSSIIDLKPSPGRFPVGAILLIGLGFVLLLDTTDIISFEQLQRYWPVGLIVLGLYLLYNRLNPPSPSVPPASSANSEAHR